MEEYHPCTQEACNQRQFPGTQHKCFPTHGLSSQNNLEVVLYSGQSSKIQYRKKSPVGEGLEYNHVGISWGSHTTAGPHTIHLCIIVIYHSILDEQEPAKIQLSISLLNISSQALSYLLSIPQLKRLKSFPMHAPC